MSLRRFLAGLSPIAIAAVLASVAPLPVNSALFLRGGATTSTPPAYTGLCDLAPCDVAYSVTRSPTRSYSGPLFKLWNGTTTLDVGQDSNHVVDLSGVPAFCASKNCRYAGFYDAINGNFLPPSLNVGPGAGCIGVDPYLCAAPFFIDPETGLPIVVTVNPSQYYTGDSPATGLIGGTHAVGVYWYGRNEGTSSCCGFFGPAHSVSAGNTPGTDFLPALQNGSAGFGGSCSDGEHVCSHLDIEIFMDDGADYAPTTLQNISNLWTWDGAAATNTLKDYVNSATPIYSASPVSGTSINWGTTIRLGGGGDLSHVNSFWREGVITNSLFSASDYTALHDNIMSFYASRSPDVCASTADYRYYWHNGSQGTSGDMGISATLVGYALRRMSASYWGPIADLRDAAGTVNTYGPDTTPGSCKIDPAAKVFCDLHPPCTVAKAYHQTTFSTVDIGNIPDIKLDAAQATPAAQPEVKWNGLNGLPTMVFAGAQELCTPALGSNLSSYIDVFSVVAKRTSTTTTNAVLNVASSGSYLGFGGANQTTGVFTSTVTGTQTDGAFHSLIHEIANGTATLYVDNVSVGSGAASYPTMDAGPICLGSKNGSSFFTGELAEATAGVNGIPGVVTAEVTAAALYAKQHSAWGI